MYPSAIRYAKPLSACQSIASDQRGIGKTSTFSLRSRHVWYVPFVKKAGRFGVSCQTVFQMLGMIATIASTGRTIRAARGATGEAAQDATATPAPSATNIEKRTGSAL